MTGRIVDLSYNLDESTPPFPGNGRVEISVVQTIPAHHPAGKHGKSNVCSVKTNVHTGTHIDAPFHYYRDGQSVDDIPLNRCMGKACLIDLSSKSPNANITTRDLRQYQDKIHHTPNVILNTGWAENWGMNNYFIDFPVLTPDAAKLLVDSGASLIGIDTPSIDKPPHDSHFIVLGNDVLIVENLTNLDRIGSEFFQLIALPLKITGRDGSPVRACALIETP